VRSWERTHVLLPLIGIYDTVNSQVQPTPVVHWDKRYAHTDSNAWNYFTQSHRHTLFHPNFGGVPVAPDRPCWVRVSRCLKLFGREIIFDVFQPITVPKVNVADRQTTYNLITALCVASPGKKWNYAPLSTSLTLTDSQALRYSIASSAILSEQAEHAFELPLGLMLPFSHWTEWKRPKVKKNQSQSH